MKHTNRAGLLIAAGESIKMQEKAGIEPVLKIGGKVELDSTYMPLYNSDSSSYEFPLAVVEGKAVFVGDELWCEVSNHLFTVKRLCNEGKAFEYATIYGGRMCVSTDSVSWNPPKPETVVVELTIDEAEWYAHCRDEFGFVGKRACSFMDKCRKALENS